MPRSIAPNPMIGILTYAHPRPEPRGLMTCAYCGSRYDQFGPNVSRIYAQCADCRTKDGLNGPKPVGNVPRGTSTRPSGRPLRRKRSRRVRHRVRAGFSNNNQLRTALSGELRQWIWDNRGMLFLLTSSYVLIGVVGFWGWL